MLGGRRTYISKQLRRKTNEVWVILPYGENVLNGAELQVFLNVGQFLDHSREVVSII